MEQKDFMEIIHQDEVLDDTSLDLLKGGSGSDWCFIYVKIGTACNKNGKAEEEENEEDENPPEEQPKEN